MNKHLLGKCFLSVLVGIVIASHFQAEPPRANLGRKVSSFTLPDPRGTARLTLADFRGKKAIVVLFIGTECPLNNAYMPRLAKLHQKYSSKGVQFLAINSNVQDDPGKVAKHAKKYRIPFPVLKDVNNKVADQFGAVRTPEAFVLDGNFVVRYQGRIDDQFAIDIQRPRPRREDLGMALEEVLAGKEVSRRTTEAAGCMIGRAPRPKKNASVTFTKHVSRILQEHCQECHRPDQIGPMALTDYEDVAAWAETIKEVVDDKRMPPWYADPRFGKFSNDRRLPEEDRQLLFDWIEQGCPEGDIKDLPPPAKFAEGWRIGKPDLILRMPEAYDVPAEMPRRGIPYRHFMIDPGFTEDKWVLRAEAKPDAGSVVHHIIVFIHPKEKRRFNPDDPRNVILCGTAPGDMPLIMPKGMGKRIPAGARLVFQMHYTPNGIPQKDRSSMGLIFGEGPLQEVRSLPVFNFLFRIPANTENHRVESQFAFRRPGKIINFMPHMHLRGKDFLYEAISPDGKKETLLFVPRFNFNWQSVYRLQEPLAMPKGSKIHCIAHFDNSAKNPNNPDHNRTVYWGDQTWQEMMIGWMDVTFDE